MADQNLLPASQKSKALSMPERVKKIKADIERGILPKLTNKRKKFLSLYLDFENKRCFFNALACVQETFNLKDKTGGAARSMAWEYQEILSPWINQYLDELCFTEQKIKSKVYELMNARKTKYFSYQGAVMEEREVEALDIQLKAVDLAAELKGMKKRADKAPRAVFNINFGNMAVEFSAVDGAAGSE